MAVNANVKGEAGSASAGVRLPDGQFVAGVVIVDPSGNLPGDAGYVGSNAGVLSPGLSGSPVAGSFWRLSHSPVANTQAVVTQAAGGAGVRNVLTAIQASIATGASAPAALQLDLNVLDSLSFTILWTMHLAIPAVAGQVVPINIPLLIVGTVNAQMLIDFSVAGGANTFESINAQGYQIA